MILINHGTLPTPSYFGIVCRKRGVPAPRELLAHLQDMLNRHGPCPYVQSSLEALGIGWRDAPPLPDAEMQEAVDAVAAVEMHDGTHPNCRACEATRRWERAF